MSLGLQIGHDRELRHVVLGVTDDILEQVVATLTSAKSKSTVFEWIAPLLSALVFG